MKNSIMLTVPDQIKSKKKMRRKKISSTSHTRHCETNKSLISASAGCQFAVCLMPFCGLAGLLPYRLTNTTSLLTVCCLSLRAYGVSYTRNLLDSPRPLPPFPPPNFFSTRFGLPAWPRHSPRMDKTNGLWLTYLSYKSGPNNSTCRFHYPFMHAYYALTDADTCKNQIQ